MLETASSKRDFLVVAAFTALAVLPFQGMAFHVDEPFFIATARAGAAAAAQAWDINNNPPMILWLLKPAMRLAGTNERALRFLFFPFDLMSALALLLLAARFLKKPLWPVLAVLAGPAYLINVNHLMAEKLAAAFGFAGVYAAVRGIDDEESSWYWASAPLLAAALLSKYLSVFLPLTVAFYARRRGVAPAKILGYLALVGSGLVVWLLGPEGRSVFRGVLAVSRQSAAHPWSAPAHRLRSLLAFTGGCSLAVLFWMPAMVTRRSALVCLGLAVVLFCPSLDSAPVRLIDRLTGIVFSAGALASLAGLFKPGLRENRGRTLWLAWLASSLPLILGYWSVMARTTLFCLPALTFAWAERLEGPLPETRWLRLRLAGFAASGAIGLALALVDYRYAQAQKEMATLVQRDYLSKGKTVWCAAHLGLRHYLLAAGARAIDWERGGWDLPKPGDVVVVSQTNSNAPSPRKRFLANVYRIDVQSPIPLRLISAFGGEGGFYSNISGFLPYSPSLEPLEEFRVVEMR